MFESWGDGARSLTGAVTALTGGKGGAYPSGTSLLIRGASESVIIDPSVTVVEKGAPADVDAVINSHGHEDHMAGNGSFPNARIHMHDDDLPAAQGIDGLLAIFGYNIDDNPEMALTFQEEFHYTPRPDATGFQDGHVWDLGGGVSVEAVHLPGHTRGHSGFRITGGVFFLSDIDLSGFGPYYGDVWSDLDQFEESLVIARAEDAKYYVTFHHKGIIEERETFLEMLDAFEAVIPRRHQAMLDFLAEPRTVAEMVEHRFVYRPGVEVVFADAVEERTARLHLDRMRSRGEIEDLGDGLIRAT